MLNLLCAGENKYSDAKGMEISARVKVFTYKMQWDIVKIFKIWTQGDRKRVLTLKKEERANIWGYSIQSENVFCISRLLLFS